MTTSEQTRLECLDEFKHPFDANDCGLWCPACGAHIAAPKTEMAIVRRIGENSDDR